MLNDPIFSRFFSTVIEHVVETEPDVTVIVLDPGIVEYTDAVIVPEDVEILISPFISKLLVNDSEVDAYTSPPDWSFNVINMVYGKLAEIQETFGTAVMVVNTNAAMFNVALVSDTLSVELAVIWNEPLVVIERLENSIMPFDEVPENVPEKTPLLLRLSVMVNPMFSVSIDDFSLLYIVTSTANTELVKVG